ncbi:cobalt-factor II C20-methyltransferase [Desulforamulus reducens MI-1]|uniref:Cobalt-factor II C20-methyltransferase n=1 Tax=Desulforamulus reducens (strain ATCC BAA-1160 / DSM 100696 / MI-1) TaxID=349161 RepID=A4J836_DESRM|nr:precorrin-2 C(20)-methyltransferase [Desulforamulus reducens]ABO51239.1 cobalt-factor II C20-methyltransferase [Desulforamulus reducens MI-1]
MKGIFYGIGIGPGDPELITLKAVHILKQVDVVIAPRTNSRADSTALNIARPHIKGDTEILELIFPMVDDERELNEAWENNKLTILDLLQTGKQVAFLTLGDPMLYSTYIYILRLLAKHPVDIQTIPGITSFAASASRVGFPLAEGNEILTIVPATCQAEKLSMALALSDNVVLMKVSRNTAKLIDEMSTHHLLDHAVMVSKCGHKDESILFDLRSPELKPTYLSTILAKKHSTGIK